MPTLYSVPTLQLQYHSRYMNAPTIQHLEYDFLHQNNFQGPAKATSPAIAGCARLQVSEALMLML